jgi:hypothetical protein
MTASQWTTEEVRVRLGAASIRSASRTLHRLGINPVAREPGRSGQNLYDVAEVEAALANRPRRGARQVAGAENEMFHKSATSSKGS